MIEKLKNPRILVAVIGLAVVLLFGLTRCQHRQHLNNSSNQASSIGDFASGDTNTEVLRQLSAQLKLVKEQNKKNQTALDNLTEKSDSLSVKEVNALRHQLESILHENESKMKLLMSEISDLKSAQSEQLSHYQATMGVEDERLVGLHTQREGTITRVGDISLQLAIPEDEKSQRQSRLNRVRADNTNQNSGFSNATDSTYQPKQTKEAKLEPLYTIPAISNLANTSLLTALIGEVPNENGLVEPPFPFEAITGRRDLIAANGIDLPPEISGMKVYGYSLGVGSFLDNLSCVRAYITRVLFVYEDGHYLVFGDQDNPTSSVNTSDTLGYLTDLYGNPCIPGEFITNAPQVLGVLVAAGTVSASADALAEAQTTTFTDSTSSSSVVSGSMGKYALGSGVSDSMSKTVDWILNRVKGTFDVVYLPASKEGKPVRLVINFTKTIPIDKDYHGRKLLFSKKSKSKGGMSNLNGDKIYDNFD